MSYFQGLRADQSTSRDMAKCKVCFTTLILSTWSSSFVPFGGVLPDVSLRCGEVQMPLLSGESYRMYLKHELHPKTLLAMSQSNDDFLLKDAKLREAIYQREVF